MKVLVCGSRDWTDHEAIDRRLGGLPGEHEDITIIHGAAPGADTMAAHAAYRRGFVPIAFPADWKTYGKRAGILRNLEMLDDGPDLVIAFQRGESRGTQHTIDAARRRRIPVEVHTEAG